MDNLQILKKVKKEAMQAMKEKKILASFIISSSMYYMNSTTEENVKLLMNANNIMKRKTTGKKFNEDTISLIGAEEKGCKYKNYDSIEDCIYDWMLSFKSSIIKGVWDLDTAINKLSNKDLTKENLQPYVDAYKLKDIDNEVLKELYPNNQTVVEIPVSNNTSAYQKISKYKSNRDNSRVGVSKRKKEIEAPKNLIFEKGSKFVVRSINIFYGPESTVATRCFSGNVWLYNGIMINGKYAIVTNKDNLGKGREFIDGYIKKSDLE